MSRARVLAPDEGLKLAPAPDVAFPLKTGADETQRCLDVLRVHGAAAILEGTVRFEVSGGDH